MHPGPLWIARFAEQLSVVQPAIDRELACRIAYAAYPEDGEPPDPCIAARGLPALDVAAARDCPSCAVMQLQACAQVCGPAVPRQERIACERRIGPKPPPHL